MAEKYMTESEARNVVDKYTAIEGDIRSTQEILDSGAIPRLEGYVVRPGMKFGSDFIIYEQGPGFDHSQWVVHVEKDDIELQAINIVRAGRLAASVKKRYLISTITPDSEIVFYGFDRVKI